MKYSAAMYYPTPDLGLLDFVFHALWLSSRVTSKKIREIPKKFTEKSKNFTQKFKKKSQRNKKISPRHPKYFIRKSKKSQ